MALAGDAEDVEGLLPGHGAGDRGQEVGLQLLAGRGREALFKPVVYGVDVDGVADLTRMQQR